MLKDEYKFDDPKKHIARYPAKTADEIEWVDKIMIKLDQLIEEDRKEFEEELKEEGEYKDVEIVSTPESSADTSFIYTNDFKEKLDAYNNLT